MMLFSILKQNFRDIGGGYMPEMSEENYSAIMSAIEELRAKNLELHKTIQDMTNMNKALLSSNGGHQDKTVDLEARHKELEDKLKGSIK